MTDTGATERISESMPAVAAAVDDTTIVGRAPFAGTVTGVTYAPDAAITGLTANSRTLSVVNRGQTGVGTATVASQAFITGVNAAAGDETALPLSGTAGNLVLAEGDMLAWVSTHVGATGLADPGGLVTIAITRRYA
jgi:hypothetical protein